MLQGEYKHTLDAKSRLVAPSKLRDELGTKFYITKGFDQCLYIFPEESWMKFVQKINGLPASQEKVRRVQRRFIGSSQECEPDKQGRFLIPQTLRDYAGLKQDVTFIGQAGHAEIWDSEAYDKLEAETLTPENLAAVMEELDF